MSRERDVSLEALRGIAAVTVVAWHILLGFAPFLVHSPQSLLANSPFFGLVNGSAAVTVFFVLSGFVLTGPYALSFDTARMRKAIFKRLPRLAGPVLISVLTSWAIYKAGLYSYRDVARLIPSDWMLSHHIGDYTVLGSTFLGAVSEGSFLTFFEDGNTYNSSLWTMHHEFMGSMVVFAFATVSALVLRRGVEKASFLIIALISAHFSYEEMVPFLVGAGLAVFLPSGIRAIPHWTSLVLVVIGIYLAGYHQLGLDAYSLVDYLFLLPFMKVSYVNTIAAASLIIAFRSSKNIQLWLSGNWAELLGRLSFPLYLIHIPILFSAGCYTFLILDDEIGVQSAVFAAGLITILGSLAAAVPLMFFNDWWVNIINRLADRLLAGSENQQGPAHVTQIEH